MIILKLKFITNFRIVFMHFLIFLYSHFLFIQFLILNFLLFLNHFLIQIEDFPKFICSEVILFVELKPINSNFLEFLFIQFTVNLIKILNF